MSSPTRSGELPGWRHAILNARYARAATKELSLASSWLRTTEGSGPVGTVTGERGRVASRSRGGAPTRGGPRWRSEGRRAGRDVSRRSLTLSPFTTEGDRIPHDLGR